MTTFTARHTVTVTIPEPGPAAYFEVTNITGRVIGRTASASDANRAGAVALAATKMGGAHAYDADGTRLPEVDALLYVDVHTARDAARSDVEKAEEAGTIAYNRGESQVPSLNATIRDLIADAKVGEARTLDLFNAFTTAWHRNADHDLARQARLDADRLPA